MPDSHLQQIDEQGQGAPHKAAKHASRLPLLQALGQPGADLSARDRLGRRALDVAIDTKHFAFGAPQERMALLKLLDGGEADMSRAHAATAAVRRRDS